MNKKRRYKSRL